MARWQPIIGGVLIGAGFLIALTSGILAYLFLWQWLWLLVASLLMVAGYVAIKRGSNSEDQKDEASSLRHIDRLKRKGTRVLVDLSQCKIVSSRFTQPEKDIDYLDELEAVTLMTEAGSYREPSIECAALVYQHTFPSGRKRKFYGNTHLDAKSLEIKCVTQGTTTLFMNPSKPGDYYFDLEFLTTEK